MSFIWGDTPVAGDPLYSWPTYSKVGGGTVSSNSIVIDGNEAQLKREDEEIIVILSAILREL